jgi:homoserine acetyltransferase
VVPGVQVPDGRRVSYIAIHVHDPPLWNFSNRYPDLNSFLRERWEGGYINNWDANDMIALLNTWQKGDISIVRDGGDYEKALKSIKAKGLIMPSKTDLYFPVSLPSSSRESTTDTIKAGGQRNRSVPPQRC